MEGNRPGEQLRGEQVDDEAAAKAALRQQAGDVDVVGAAKAGVLLQVGHRRRGDRVAAHFGGE